MTITWIQAILFGLLACLASMPGMGGTAIGNYTLGRPLVAGLIVGLIVGDVSTGIMVGAAIQVIYIALVTPGGTVSADVRAISYIGIPLSIAAIKGLGIDPSTVEAAQMAAALGAAVGTLGTVLFYGTATMNLVWQHIGWKAVEKGDFKKLYAVDMILPWVSHILFSFIPTLIITKMGANMVDIIKTTLPMDGLAMKTLFTVGSLLTFLFGFILAAFMGVNLIGSAKVGGFFAVINYKIKMIQIAKPVASGGGNAVYDDGDEI